MDSLNNTALAVVGTLYWGGHLGGQEEDGTLGKPIPLQVNVKGQEVDHYKNIR